MNQRTIKKKSTADFTAKRNIAHRQTAETARRPEPPSIASYEGQRTFSGRRSRSRGLPAEFPYSIFKTLQKERFAQ